MSEQVANETPAGSPPAEIFDREDVAEFDADDAKAGRVIGKLLTLFFVYTIVATGIVGLWTYFVVSR